MNISPVFSIIKNFIFPKRCPYCNKLIKVSEYACNSCIDKFPFTYIDGFTKGGFICVSSFPYEDIFKNAILNIKFKSKTAYAPQVAVTMVRDINDCYKDKNFDFITSVPLHKKRYRKRGFNQSRLLAENISKQLKTPYIEALVKVKNNKPQHTIKGKERMSNVKNAYKVIDKAIIKDKNILIIDDIITTGYTLGECCKVLDKGGAKDVICATFCRVI